MKIPRSIRNETQSMFSKRSFNNKYLLLAVCFSFILQLVVIYVPFFWFFFYTVPLSLYDWGLMFILCFSFVVVLDIGKVLLAKWKGKRVEIPDYKRDVVIEEIDN